jgi:hypothetical protein
MIAIILPMKSTVYVIYLNSLLNQKLGSKDALPRIIIPIKERA